MIRAKSTSSFLHPQNANQDLSHFFQTIGYELYLIISDLLKCDERDVVSSH
jgi:hypothetical protein